MDRSDTLKSHTFICHICALTSKFVYVTLMKLCSHEFAQLLPRLTTLHLWTLDKEEDQFLITLDHLFLNLEELGENSVWII